MPWEQLFDCKRSKLTIIAIARDLQSDAFALDAPIARQPGIKRSEGDSRWGRCEDSRQSHEILRPVNEKTESAGRIICHGAYL